MFSTYRVCENISKCFLRYSSTNSRHLANDQINPFVYNRNPRNLERLRIAYKPAGYNLDKPGREFWHKLVLKPSKRSITANIIHNTEKIVIEASTSEWALRKHLYRSNDTASYIVLAKVLAQRCLESGITEIFCNIEAVPGTKIALFLEEVKKCGVSLEEPPRYVPPHPLGNRPEKPWEILE